MLINNNNNKKNTPAGYSPANIYESKFFIMLFPKGIAPLIPH